VERSLHKLATSDAGLLEQAFRGKRYAFLMESTDEFIHAERKKIICLIGNPVVIYFNPEKTDTEAKQGAVSNLDILNNIRSFHDRIRIRRSHFEENCFF
jgi:hypothetical protein